MAHAPSLSIVIPTFNSEESLPVLMDRLATVLKSLGAPYEIIIVNDGSRDKTETVLAQLARQVSNLVPVTLGRNYGQHNALLCGIRLAKHEVIVTLDDDLQNPPEEIPELLDRLNEGYDVVYGTPLEQHYGLGRGLATALVKWAFSVAMGLKIAEQISAFRVFRTRLRDSFAQFNGPYVSIDVLLSWGTTRFGSVPVRHDAWQRPRVPLLSVHYFDFLRHPTIYARHSRRIFRSSVYESDRSSLLCR